MTHYEQMVDGLDVEKIISNWQAIKEKKQAELAYFKAHQNEIESSQGQQEEKQKFSSQDNLPADDTPKEGDSLGKHKGNYN